MTDALQMNDDDDDDDDDGDDDDVDDDDDIMTMMMMMIMIMIMIRWSDDPMIRWWIIVELVLDIAVWFAITIYH